MKIHPRLDTAFNAVIGLTMFVLVIFGCAILLVVAEREPMGLCVVAGSALIAAALFFRKPPVVNNLSLGHPDSIEIIDGVRALLRKAETDD